MKLFEPQMLFTAWSVIVFIAIFLVVIIDNLKDK